MDPPLPFDTHLRAMAFLWRLYLRELEARPLVTKWYVWNLPLSRLHCHVAHCLPHHPPAYRCIRRVFTATAHCLLKPTRVYG